MASASERQDGHDPAATQAFFAFFLSLVIIAGSFFIFLLVMIVGQEKEQSQGRYQKKDGHAEEGLEDEPLPTSVAGFRASAFFALLVFSLCTMISNHQLHINHHIKPPAAYQPPY